MDLLSASYFMDGKILTIEKVKDGKRRVNKEERKDEMKMNGGTEDDSNDEELAGSRHQKPKWTPSFYHKANRDIYNYVGQEITIEESIDSYGAMIWPAALALSHYLETYREQFCLLDKTVLEIGAGPGLLSIVAALLGASVTATDLPEVLGNLQSNLMRNTRGRSRHLPQVATLAWGHDLERNYPRSVYHYDYVLAADVVYHHDFLEELLITMKYFCQPGTTLIWANKVRFGTDLKFTEKFKNAFNTTVLSEEGDVKIFMATYKDETIGGYLTGGMQFEREVQNKEEEEESTEEEEEEEEEQEEEDDEKGYRSIQNDLKEGVNREKEKNKEEQVGEEEEEGKRNIKSDMKDDKHMKAGTEGKAHLCSLESNVQKEQRLDSAPCFYSMANKDVYNFLGQEIIIHESFDSCGGTVWPAAVALSQYLETHWQQISLLDKAVLEIGAGTGLLSVVATLLGARMTATDLPEILSNLRCNLSRNTRGRCRHTPKVEALSWSRDLGHTHPRSAYHYDYVLATEVVYHHDFLDELLFTMKHFCHPGTTLIWANMIRFKTDREFTEKFLKTFHTTLLIEEGEIQIFMATSREEETERDLAEGVCDGLKDESSTETSNKAHTGEENYLDDKEDSKKDQEKECNEEDSSERQIMDHLDEGYEEDEDGETDDSRCSTATSDEELIEEDTKQVTVQKVKQPSWAQSCVTKYGKDIYHYAGQDIGIYESIDSYGAVMWPAALALCHILENNWLKEDLTGKKVLELGSGTGLVAIVASLLGASVTATDLPDVLGNLRSNLMRNTSGRSKYSPRVLSLAWGHNLDRYYPRSLYQYDYVLAADVVYHHEFLDELLITMKHFCQPGTTLIWANKVRFVTDLKFTENFKNAFNTSMLFEEDDMKIFMATSKETNRDFIRRRANLY